MKRRAIALLLALAVAAGVLPLQVCAVDSTQKLVAITFDDGPGKYTDELLDGLAERGVVVTFFMQGCNAERYPSVVQRAYEAGHQIASHTYDHPYLTKLSTSEIRSQVSKTASILNEAIGVSNTYMLRPPYGAYNDTVLSTIGTPAIYWSLDTRDWESRDAEKVYAQIVSNVKDGDIILLHDLYSSSVEGALRGIDALLEQGYELVTVRELLRRRGVQAEAGEIYFSARKNTVNLPGISQPTVTVTAVDGGQLVTLSADAGATIYYTLDGTAPTSGSSVYVEPFVLETGATVKAFAALDLNGGRSQVTTAEVELPRAQAPVISQENGQVTITAVGTVYYTLDGSEPTEASTVYTGPFQVAAGTWIRAFSGPAQAGQRSSLESCLLYSARGNGFSDVEPGSWYYSAVDAVVANGWMTTDGTTFSPEEALTRGMLASVLYRLSGSPDTAGTLQYSDVSDASPDWKAIVWASEQGIVTGYADGTFHPDDPVTREELAVMLYRLWPDRETPGAQQDVLDGYEDAGSVRAYALDAMRWAVGAGLIKGTSETVLAPEADTTRAQMAVIALRYQAMVQSASSAADESGEGSGQ